MDFRRLRRQKVLQYLCVGRPLDFHGAESAHEFFYYAIIETMQWSHPELQGDLPHPCRAHSATPVGRKIVIIGGGEGASYLNSVHVFDILMRRWSRSTFTATGVPRAHHGSIPEQNLDIRLWKRATCAERRLDTRCRRLARWDAWAASHDIGAQATLTLTARRSYGQFAEGNDRRWR